MVKRRTEMPSLERLAETLILVDVADAGSVRELADAFAEFAAWAKGPGVAPEIADVAADCVCTVTEIAGADSDAALVALGELGHRFERLQSTILAFSPTEEDAADTPSAPAKRGRATAPIASDTTQTGICDDPSLIADFVVRATELLELADEHLVVLERSPGRRDVLDEVFRSFHTLKGMAGFLSLDQLQATAHAAESILDAPRHGEARLEQRDLVSLFEAIDEMKRRVAAVGAGPALASAMSAEAAKADKSTAADGGALAAPVEQEPAHDLVGESAAVALTRATVRVDENRLDRLLDAIGEMVIAESMASETLRSGDSGDRLVQQLARLDKITRELQELATSLRMMPMGPTFRRMSRVVRDLSHSTGKRVELVVSGAETELDKEMVDRLGDPLIHLLRNAIDHGIEPPEVRAASGKDAIGRVELRAYHHGGSVLVEVSDDGGGLDAEAIAGHARARGILGEGVALDEQATLALILQPGFSTAQEVTDVSGRGVGLDVVKRAVDDLRGQLSVESTPGEGTRFTIRLPLTLAIIDGMVLRVGAERYIVPTGAIERSVRPMASELSSVLNRGTLLVTDDGLVPLLHLGTLFDEPGAEPDPCRAIVVICEAGGRSVGLVACELLGQQQTVIKGLGDDLRGASGLAGGAIMSDGRVGLILDVTGLVTLANAEGGE